MSLPLFILPLLLGLSIGAGLVRWHCRKVMREMHQVHEFCEDASYRAGLDRGRSEQGRDEADAWYRKGFKDGRHAERMHQRAAAGPQR